MIKFIIAHNFFIRTFQRNVMTTNCWFTIIEKQNCHNFSFISDTHPIGVNLMECDVAYKRLLKWNTN